ncbi:hypothetical protein L1987_65111 [Smallanthus sonchifolius]|uniref:Uncharacterized protein n=1 Tax=Smallanthus sonchifolius TaxID=185202 RepID=A0ACB9BTF0_9ASTR|nr:hypothetical protein L1987_65111 [Smallanthus sonchifolius]
MSTLQPHETLKNSYAAPTVRLRCLHSCSPLTFYLFFCSYLFCPWFVLWYTKIEGTSIRANETSTLRVGESIVYSIP